MIFSSLTFLLVFLPIILFLYYLIPGWAKNAALLLGSLIFYAWGEPVYIVLMLYSILMNYTLGLLMEKQEKARRQILVFGVILNLFLLGFFKYAGFLAESFNSIFGRFGLSLPVREIALPIGISFYTFQALSYLIDLYRGKFPAQKSLIRFALYITMFPQLIAGPIVRYESVAKELEIRSLSPAKFGRGAMLFIEGLAMKVLLANQVGSIADELRALSGSLSTVSAWLGALAYFFQIYFDFAGYSTMAIGLGLMLGFTFTKNFDYPYLSVSVTEFWRRWHISLGTWFREYVYIPLGGNRVSTLKHIRNILIVWILTGLWHGAAWNFVLWGLYYGLLLLFEKYVLSRIRFPKVIGWIYTTVLVLIGWVIFSGESLSQSLSMLAAMFGAGGWLSGQAVSAAGGALSGVAASAAGGALSGVAASTAGGALSGVAASTAGGALSGMAASAVGGALSGVAASAAGTALFDQTALYYLTTGWRILLICAICATPLLRNIRDRLLQFFAGRVILTVVYVGLLALAILFLVVQNYNPFLYFRF